jgi:hypothetical protein
MKRNRAHKKKRPGHLLIVHIHCDNEPTIFVPIERKIVKAYKQKGIDFKVHLMKLLENIVNSDA